MEQDKTHPLVLAAAGAVIASSALAAADRSAAVRQVFNGEQE